MSDGRFIVGVDVGGTNVVVGTVPEDGSTVYGLRQVPTRVNNGAEAVVKQIGTLVQESLEATRATLGPNIDVVGVGIGAPGPLDTARGIVRRSTTTPTAPFSASGGRVQPAVPRM